MKKIISILLAVMLAVLTCCFFVACEGEEQEQDNTEEIVQETDSDKAEKIAEKYFEAIATGNSELFFEIVPLDFYCDDVGLHISAEEYYDDTYGESMHEQFIDEWCRLIENAPIELEDDYGEGVKREYIVNSVNVMNIDELSEKFIEGVESEYEGSVTRWEFEYELAEVLDGYMSEWWSSVYDDFQSMQAIGLVNASVRILSSYDIEESEQVVFCVVKSNDKWYLVGTEGDFLYEYASDIEKIILSAE